MRQDTSAAAANIHHYNFTMVQQYHKEANGKRVICSQEYYSLDAGVALETVKKHAKDSAEVLMYGACFCPFVQRVWIALEVKGIDYHYVEVDPYQKPPELLKVNPRGLVPAVVHDDHSLLESMVMLDYIEEAFSEPNTSKNYIPLLPRREISRSSAIISDYGATTSASGFFKI